MTLPSSTSETAIRNRMTRDGAAPLAIETFLHYWRQLARGETGLISQHELEAVPDAPRAETLPPPGDVGALLRHTVVIKLNGGLGTGMGLDRAKSLLPAKNGVSFLDIIARQILHLRKAESAPGLPLVFMNSFRTEADTLAALAKYPELAGEQKDTPLSFLQNRVPKILASTLAPAEWPADPEHEWCPPGHGDLYTALQTTGMLARLRAAGMEYAFVSNADNLGATLDPRILAWFASSCLPFAMEVADRTEADRKGGHVAKRCGGGLLLRESAQCPPDETADFQDIRRHRYFNTNNLWLHLVSLERELEKRKGILGLPLIRNDKTVDPTDKKSPAVVQLETAMGAALSAFSRSGILCVPRTRFAPVKTSDDLLALWSDAYELTPEGHVRLHPSRHGQPPVVKLDPAFYKFIADFQKRFPAGAPSLLHCDRIEIKGDITFGRNITARGSVLLNASQPQTIPDGTTLGPA